MMTEEGKKLSKISFTWVWSGLPVKFVWFGLPDRFGLEFRHDIIF